MTEGDGDGGNDLRLVTEAAFRRFEAVNSEYVKILFRSCLDLLPEAETTASLVSRCVEAFCEIERVEEGRGYGGIDGSVVSLFLDGVASVGAREFEVTVESMGGRLGSHDLLYCMVDIYLKEHGGKMTEEQKAQICQSVDCTRLSPEILVDAVQNPRMPLRFIIRAMLVEHLRTRHSFLHAVATATPHPSSGSQEPTTKAISAAKSGPPAPTLGAILHRDAALRQSAQLRAAMAATKSRIQSLEEELSAMKLQLMNETTVVETEESDSNPVGSRSMLNSGRSLSFSHYRPPKESNKIERGERGSVSSLSSRFTRKAAEGREVGMEDEMAGKNSPRVRSSMRERLIRGLKSAFGSLNTNSATKGS
ncbi:hypothetical protein SAY86_025406 [Trapa natans]|uniref:NPH3 domain-containing protein n=1 Tax=Trapa natans TaxID=22666 RepID=A0AAN7RIZ2_TRANT|nr:hypothetical protein SAY86_025406 [Trapa natans]